MGQACPSESQPGAVRLLGLHQRHNHCVFSPLRHCRDLALLVSTYSTVTSINSNAVITTFTTHTSRIAGCCDKPRQYLWILTDKTVSRTAVGVLVQQYTTTTCLTALGRSLQFNKTKTKPYSCFVLFMFCQICHVRPHQLPTKTNKYSHSATLK